jgi:hypothetical protein
MSDDLDSKANASALEIGAEEKTHPDVADDDYTADALRALAALGAHGEDQIKVMLQLGGAVARAKSQLKHGDFTRWCEDTLKRKATWCSAHRRLFEIQEDIEPARAWAKETKHHWADCFSVERLLKLVAESKKAKRTDNATNDIPPAPKARRKLTDVLAELAQAQERIAQDDADFVALRDELPPEVDARARELAPLAAVNDVAATEELAKLGRRFHWRLRDLVGRETCGAPQVSDTAPEDSAGPRPGVAETDARVEEEGGAPDHGNVQDSSRASAAPSAAPLDLGAAAVVDEANPKGADGFHEIRPENSLANNLRALGNAWQRHRLSQHSNAQQRPRPRRPPNWGTPMNFNPSSAPVRIPQNKPAREIAQALLALPVARRFDIALLRPSDLPPSERFETEADARARRDAELERFEQIPGLAHVADRLHFCTAETPCAQVYCPICGRRFRRWFIGQALEHQSHLDLEFMTIALELVPTQMMPKCDLLVVKPRIAQRFRRAAPSAKFVLGGIEAEYLQGDDAFLVHAHLLVSRLPDDELAVLRSAFADIDITRTVKVQALPNPATQISYALKFTTYHRPGPQNGSRRPMAFPLPDRALKALTLWRARHGFLDFVFMMGLRRRGGDFSRAELSDPRHIPQLLGGRFDNFEGSDPERVDDSLCQLGTDAANHSRAEIFLDALGGGRRGGFEQIGFELQAMGAIGHPNADGVYELARRYRGGVPDDRDEVTFATRLHLQDGETIFLIVKSHPFDRADEHFTRSGRVGCRPQDAYWPPMESLG